MDQAADVTTRYDLFSTDGGARFVWRYRDEGVGLEADALTVVRTGRWTRVPFADIAQVTLSTAAAGQSRQMGQCTLTLLNGRRIVVTSANASGLADGRRDTAYRQFVRDFHRALIESGAAPAIRFHSGFTQARMNGLVVALMVGTLFFVVLPLALLLATGDPQVLWLLAGGFVLILPAWRVANANQPADYQAGAPPDLLP